MVLSTRTALLRFALWFCTFQNGDLSMEQQTRRPDLLELLLQSVSPVSSSPSPDRKKNSLKFIAKKTRKLIKIQQKNFCPLKKSDSDVS